MQPAKHLPFIKNLQQTDTAGHAELSAGLLAPWPFISPKYLYDGLGSRLFEAICELPQYYLTRTEAEIMQAHLAEITESAGQGTTLIDLGAGNCAKAARMFPALLPRQYVAIDISADFLCEALVLLQQRFPGIEMLGLVQDFSSALFLPEQVRQERRLFFYPGSSLGNFTPRQALSFLQRVRAACREKEDALLIGIDLVKDKAILEAAYDDALGVTAAFNLNLLLHLNRLLHADFDVRDWRHQAFFNTGESRIEMHLEARREVAVCWPDGKRGFAKGERIHTENSYKYQPDDFFALLEQAGFGNMRSWTDARGWFMVCHARAT